MPMVRILNSSYIINAINSKKSGLSTSASAQEIAAYITAYWTGGSTGGNITYQYHYHSSSCYCTGTIINVDGPIRNEDGSRYYVSYCTNGHRIVNGNGTGEQCGINLCGKSNGQIIGATITY